MSWEDLPPEETEALAAIRTIVPRADPVVVEKQGQAMASKEAFVWEQEGVFKYSLARAKQHITFHSMVMYAYPELADGIPSFAPAAKTRKGCFNLKRLTDLDLPAFETWLQQNAARDFTPVLERYR